MKAEFVNTLYDSYRVENFRDTACATIIAAMINISQRSTRLYGTTKTNAPASVALDLLEKLSKYSRDSENSFSYPEAKGLLWKTIIHKWLCRDDKVSIEAARIVAYTKFKVLIDLEPERKIFEELLREQVRRDISHRTYQIFFDVAPRERCEDYPAIRIVGQEFVRDHPNNFMGKFKVGGG